MSSLLSPLVVGVIRLNLVAIRSVPVRYRVDACVVFVVALVIFAAVLVLSCVGCSELCEVRGGVSDVLGGGRMT